MEDIAETGGERNGDVESEEMDVTPNLDGGVLKKILKEGAGTGTPSPGCTVQVHYTGKFTDGTVFDSSRDREPFEFVLGKGTVIKGWDIGVATMKLNEVALLTCKPEYAYGKSGSQKIPANTTLMFEVEMLGWQAEDLSPKKDGSILKTMIFPGEGFSCPDDFSTVTVQLKGECDGVLFEEREVTFRLGEGVEFNICPGVEKALEKFKLKETSVLEIAPKYAFGSEGKSELGVPPNTSVKYTVTLKAFDNLKESWNMNSEEKLQYALQFKERGSSYFNNGKYQIAVKMYKKSKEYIEREIGFSEEEEKERKKLLVATFLNLALCYLKIGDSLCAKDMCTSALEFDAKNEKAYFRRGQALMALKEPGEAKKDFEKVISIEPGNKLAAKNIVICKDLIKEHKEREKKIYASMFEKFAKYDREREEAERKREPDVMKTLGEWGEDEREHAPTKFEKENPNILMLDGTGDFKNM